MSYLVWEMWRSPTGEGGESGSSDVRAWWEEECGGLFVQASAFLLALLVVLLCRRSISRGSIHLGHAWLHTQSKTLRFVSTCSSSTFCQWHLQAAVLCREGWVGAAGEYIHEHEAVCFKMANAWKLAVSRRFCWAVGELWPGMRLFPAVVSQV